MRYTILGFNQAKVVQNDLDLTDLLLLDYIIKANGNPNMKHIVKDDVAYVWLSHSKIHEDLPILNISEGTLRNRISKLKKDGFLISETTANNATKGTMSFYCASEKTMSFLNDVETPPCHAKMTSNNSINNYNKLNTLSKDNVRTSAEQLEFNFGVSDEKSKKITNNEEYLDACLLINNFTDDKELKKLLGELLDNRLSLASNQRHHFYASTFKHYLDELSKVHNKIGAVKLSLQYNNTLKVMEPKLQYVSITSTPDTNTAPQVKYSSDEDRISKMARNDDGTPMTF